MNVFLIVFFFCVTLRWFVEGEEEEKEEGNHCARMAEYIKND